MDFSANELREFVRSSDWDNAPQSDQDKELPAPPIFPSCPAGAKLISLPSPDSCRTLNKGFLADVRDRKSNRAYRAQPMTLDELSFLLYCTQGYKCMRPQSTVAALRTVPSAGARHPIDTYLAVLMVEGLEPGLYRYQPLEHQLWMIRPATPALTEEVVGACHNQLFAGKSAVTFFWAADMYRCEWRYTTHAHKLVLLDAGHVCQNLYLACEEIGCGCCAIAAYDQQKSDQLFELNGDNNFVVYVAPVGKV